MSMSKSVTLRLSVIAIALAAGCGVVIFFTGPHGVAARAAYKRGAFSRLILKKDLSLFKIGDNVSSNRCVMLFRKSPSCYFVSTIAELNIHPSARSWTTSGLDSNKREVSIVRDVPLYLGVTNVYLFGIYKTYGTLVLGDYITFMTNNLSRIVVSELSNNGSEVYSAEFNVRRDGS
jgi:hypothetical protein